MNRFSRPTIGQQEFSCHVDIGLTVKGQGCQLLDEVIEDILVVVEVDGDEELLASVLHGDRS
jgi:hypothetical protein